MIIEINDMTTPMLQAIRTVSREVAYEQMSKIGNAVRKKAGNQMTMSKNRHHWLQRKSKITGKLYSYKSKSETKELGQRTNPNGDIDNPDSMRNMISSFLMEKNGTLVVGGRNKAFTPVTRKDGVITGTGRRQSSITKHTQSIIHKLDTGEREIKTGDRGTFKHGWGAGGIIKESVFENPKFKGRHFMMKGFGDSIPYMRSQLTAGYEKTVGRAVNKVKVNLKPSKRAVS
jgi:hypothetical protein